MVVKLGDHCDFLGGFAFKSQDLKESSGIPVVKIKNVNNKVVTLNDVQFFSKDNLTDKLKKFLLRDGDVLIAMTGQGSVGRVGRFHNLSGKHVLLNQRVGKFLPRDTLDLGYLYYVLSSDKYQKILFSAASGSGQPNLSPDIIKSIEIPYLNVKEQKNIAKVLGDLDDKIVLNNQTNQTLEQMAQALFKSWFVDFDPVFDNLLASADFKLENLETSLPDELKQKAQRRLAALDSLENAAQYKASLNALAHELQAQLPTKEATQSAVQVSEKAAETPAKPNFSANPNILAQHSNTHSHFPNEFEHNEQLGWIPKDWEASKLKEFGKIITGKTPPKKIDDAFDLEGKGVPFITPSDVEGDVFTVNAIRHLTESGVGSVKNNIVDAESVCVTCIGSQMGKTTIAPDKSVTNQQLNSIVLGKKYFRNYIFLNLRMRREELFNLGSSGSTMPILNKTSFENLSVLKPNESSLKAFDDITESCLAKILLNSQNNTKLTTMRDTLLPKLISGELQIPDVTIDKEIVD
mgnify:CR=1 FL=1